MAARHSLAILLGFAAFSALPVVPALAQDAAPPTPEVANSKFNFSGTINADSVYVRSGPGDNYYPTSKLDTDANREVSVKYGISAIPTILLFKNGQVVRKFVGLTPKPEFAGELDKATA